MTTALFSHSACLYHETPLGHPESPDRLRAVLHALESEDFAYLDRREAPRASRDQLARVHPSYFIDAVLRQIPERGFHHFDADTVVSPQSGEAAQHRRDADALESHSEQAADETRGATPAS